VGLEPALGGVGFATAIVFGLRPGQGRRFLDAVSSVLLGAIVILTAWQLVPLPLGVVRVLTPLRYENLIASRFATGSASAYATLSAVPQPTFQYLLTISGCILVLLVIRAMSFDHRNPWILTWPSWRWAVFRHRWDFTRPMRKDRKGSRQVPTRTAITFPAC
jgi:hypothetical protein